MKFIGLFFGIFFLSTSSAQRQAHLNIRGRVPASVSIPEQVLEINSKHLNNLIKTNFSKDDKRFTIRKKTESKLKYIEVIIH